MDLTHDTIAAIATPPGLGGIGIIRISGPDTIQIVSKIFPKENDLTPRHVYYGDIRHPVTGDILDEACVIYFKAPQSFTGEDVAEIQTHAGPYILNSILASILEIGARLAFQGEFTKRAFLNGKIDLTKAESIIDLIHAKNAKSHQVALAHHKGALYTHISAIRLTLMTLLEQMEGSIDFPEEVDSIDKFELKAQIKTILNTLSHILTLQDFGKLATGGINCLIVGEPNAGKSSLFNQLLGQNRSIVTPVAGTTRDFIDGQIELGGLTFNLIDTAGYREATDYIESLGIKRISQLVKKAHVILWVIDQSRSFSDTYLPLMAKIKKKPLYLILNKSDLKKRTFIDQIDDMARWPVIHTSAKKNSGLDQLKERLYTDFVSKFQHIDLDLICNVRQVHCLKEVQLHLNHLKEALDLGFEDDIMAIDLKSAILKLGEITGEEITEEVLDGIFSRFCVGK